MKPSMPSLLDVKQVYIYMQYFPVSNVMYHCVNLVAYIIIFDDIIFAGSYHSCNIYYSVIIVISPVDWSLELNLKCQTL